MWMNPVPDEDRARIKVPVSLMAALAITTVATVAWGIVPGVLTHFGDVVSLASGG